MNSTVSKVLFVVIALAVAGWLVHDKIRESEIASADEQQRAERKQQSQDAVVAASNRYGAIIDWKEKLAHSMYPFSIQIEDAIMPEDGKPIVVDGFVDDIARHDGQSYLYVSDDITGSFTIDFVLECDAATATSIIEKNESFVRVRLIAQIASVEKAQLALKSGVKTTEDSAPVEIDSSSLFIARGKCLEVVFSDN